MPRRQLDLTGKKFGSLTVVKAVGKTKHGPYLWKAVCDCGNVYTGNTTQMQNRHYCSRQCPCRYLSRIGKEYGDYIVKDYVDTDNLLVACKSCGEERIIKNSCLRLLTRCKCNPLYKSHGDRYIVVDGKRVAKSVVCKEIGITRQALSRRVKSCRMPENLCRPKGTRRIYEHRSYDEVVDILERRKNGESVQITKDIVDDILNFLITPESIDNKNE